jgi:hypothetical protein
VYKLQNPKPEARNPKWFDKLTILSQVEGQIRISNAQMIKTGGDEPSNTFARK